MALDVGINAGGDGECTGWITAKTSFPYASRVDFDILYRAVGCAANPTEPAIVYQKVSGTWNELFRTDAGHGSGYIYWNCWIQNGGGYDYKVEYGGQRAYFSIEAQQGPSGCWFHDGFVESPKDIGQQLVAGTYAKYNNAPMTGKVQLKGTNEQGAVKVFTETTPETGTGWAGMPMITLTSEHVGIWSMSWYSVDKDCSAPAPALTVRGPPCTPTWVCETPLNGYEKDGCGNRRPNPACNPGCTPKWVCETPLNGYEKDGCGNRRAATKCKPSEKESVDNTMLIAAVVVIAATIFLFGRK